MEPLTGGDSPVEQQVHSTDEILALNEPPGSPARSQVGSPQFLPAPWGPHNCPGTSVAPG